MQPSAFDGNYNYKGTGCNLHEIIARLWLYAKPLTNRDVLPDCNETDNAIRSRYINELRGRKMGIRINTTEMDYNTGIFDVELNHDEYDRYNGKDTFNNVIRDITELKLLNSCN